MNHQFIVGAPAAVLGRTGIALAAEDTQIPTRESHADPETPDTADDPVVGLLVDGLSR